jgi:hypothetical protein
MQDMQRNQRGHALQAAQQAGAANPPVGQQEAHPRMKKELTPE